VFSNSQTDSFVIHDDDTGRSLDVVGDWMPRAAGVLARSEADGLILNYARGFRERSLDFLQHWPLRRLTILARTITDLEPIYRLADTPEYLSLASSDKVALDLTGLPRLKHLSCENWSQLEPTIADCPSLEYLYAGSYTPRDLLPLANNRNLTTIRMKDRPRLESLNGVDAFASLEELGIFGAPLLKDVVDLGSASAPRKLRTLELELCRGVSTLDGIGRLTDLTYLNIGDCGDIASFAPLANLRHLKELYAYGTTRVVDGDLSPLTGLTELTNLRLKNRRDYHPAVKSIEEQIQRRLLANRAS
jgi:Leucine-rich repeat (LRR) protein